MKKIILLTSNSRISHKGLKYLSSINNKRIKIDTIVSSMDSKFEILKLFKNKIFFIDNKIRNEKKLLKRIKEKKIDLLLSIQHPWIIPSNILKLLNNNCYNIHMGKLPEYRGHHTTIHSILNNEKNNSCSFHQMNKKVDQGVIIFNSFFKITKKDTSYSLEKKFSRSLLLILKKIIKSEIKNKKINNLLYTLNGKYYSINSIDNLKQIRDKKNKKEIDLKSRAFYHPPHEPAFIMINNKKEYIYPKFLKKYFNHKN